MITGDHPSTAESIAVELGILDGGRVLTGAELDALDDDELDAALPGTTVFARVHPGAQGADRRGDAAAPAGRWR